MELNKEQQEVFDKLIDRIDNHKRLFIVDGPAGTGKTTIANALGQHFRKQGHDVLATAPSGLGASKLLGGQTVHSGFRFPPSTENDLPLPAVNNDILRSIYGWICDDAAALAVEMFEAIDTKMKEVVGLEDPFADKIVVIFIDQRQLYPPVQGGKTKPRRFITDDYLTALFETFTLPIAASRCGKSDDDAYERYLKTITEYLHQTNERILPPDCLCDDERLLVDFVYEDMEKSERLAKSANNVILTVASESATAINERLLNRCCDGDTNAIRTFELANRREYSGELSEGWSKKRECQEPLQLAVGVIVRLIDGIDVGLCTGTRLLISEIHDDTIICHRIINSNDDIDDNKRDTKSSSSLDPTTVEIKRKMLYYESRDALGFITYEQFPLELAFAITIFKARGQRFGRVGLLLAEETDEIDNVGGGLYTALAAVRGFDHIKVLKPAGVVAPKRPRLDSSSNKADEANGAQAINGASGAEA